MSLLTIISDAMLRQNQTAPSAVIASSDPGVQLRLALLQDVGNILSEKVQWQAENVGATISGDGSTRFFALPADWGGMSAGEMLQSTLFPTLPVVGPVTNEQMAAFKALPVQPLQPIWRIIQGKFEFYPAPAAGEVYNYNYYSKYWIKQASGTLVRRWTADTDTALINEDLLTSGLQYRWLKSKGFEYGEEKNDFTERMGRISGSDDDSREANMSKRGIAQDDNFWPGAFPVWTWPGPV